jgi:hypothetical protein
MTNSQPARGSRALVSRRVFLRTAATGTAGAAAWSLLGAGPAGADTDAAGTASSAGTRGPAARVVSFDAGWLFGPASAGSDQPGFDDSAFATVTLPHSVAPLSWQNWDPATWEKVWSYRKHFDAPPSLAGTGLRAPRVFLDFAAAITRATVTLNGTQVADHYGGYLPFSAEITGALKPKGNVLSVTLDSTFNLDVPPDRPAPAASSSVDYWQPGGVYRDVTLRAVPQIFLSDVFARPAHVLDAANRTVEVQATVDAAVVPSGTATLAVELRDPDNGGKPLASATAPVTITATGETTVTATLANLPAITLWDTENPKLYTVVATLIIDGSPLHDYEVRIGFREAVFALDGFFLNGKRTKLFGLNRHQFFPFAGGALPDRVQARDAYILRRELNCNAVRCSHYPQSEAFYDAADELGLLVWEEIPGWGYFGDAAWQQAAYTDTRDMIVRDRNHPSVVIWGAMPNEAGEHVAEYTLFNELAHSLDPSRPTGGDGASSDLSFVFDVVQRPRLQQRDRPGRAARAHAVPAHRCGRQALPGLRGRRHAVWPRDLLQADRHSDRPAGRGHRARPGAQHLLRQRRLLRGARLGRVRLSVRQRQRVPGREVHRGGRSVPDPQTGRRDLPVPDRPEGQTGHRARLLLGFRPDVTGHEPAAGADRVQPRRAQGLRRWRPAGDRHTRHGGLREPAVSALVRRLHRRRRRDAAGTSH